MGGRLHGQRRRLLDEGRGDRFAFETGFGFGGPQWDRRDGRERDPRLRAAPILDRKLGRDADNGDV